MKGKSKANPFDNLFSGDQPVDRADDKSSPTPQPKVKGKKSDKNYVASMTYLPKQLRLDVQQQLLNLQREGIDIDFSELVAEVLTLYLDIQKADNPDNCISEFLDRLKSKYSDI